MVQPDGGVGVHRHRQAVKHKRVAWEAPHQNLMHYIAPPGCHAGETAVAICGARGVAYFGDEPNPSPKCPMCDDLKTPQEQDATKERVPA